MNTSQGEDSVAAMQVDHNDEESQFQFGQITPNKRPRPTQGEDEDEEEEDDKGPEIAKNLMNNLASQPEEFYPFVAALNQVQVQMMEGFTLEFAEFVKVRSMLNKLKQEAVLNVKITPMTNLPKKVTIGVEQFERDQIKACDQLKKYLHTLRVDLLDKNERAIKEELLSKYSETSFRISVHAIFPMDSLSNFTKKYLTEQLDASVKVYLGLLKSKWALSLPDDFPNIASCSSNNPIKTVISNSTTKLGSKTPSSTNTEKKAAIDPSVESRFRSLEMMIEKLSGSVENLTLNYPRPPQWGGSNKKSHSSRPSSPNNQYYRGDGNNRDWYNRDWNNRDWYNGQGGGYNSNHRFPSASSNHGGRGRGKGGGRSNHQNGNY